jgi:hypothetical protein
MSANYKNGWWQVTAARNDDSASITPHNIVSPLQCNYKIFLWFLFELSRCSSCFWTDCSTFSKPKSLVGPKFGGCSVHQLVPSYSVQTRTRAVEYCLLFYPPLPRVGMVTVAGRAVSLPTFWWYCCCVVVVYSIVLCVHFQWSRPHQKCHFTYLW